jgi:hypothetical protein
MFRAPFGTTPEAFPSRSSDSLQIKKFVFQLLRRVYFGFRPSICTLSSAQNAFIVRQT